MVYKHKYVIGSEYAFYNNSENLEDNGNFASWSFDLVHADTYIQVIEDVTTLTKDVISGSDYRWYSSGFTFPQVQTGCYRFVVIDTADSDKVLYISNEFEVVDSDDGLKYSIYRNGKNIQNFNYEGLPSYYNKFHVEFFERKPINPVTSEGYDLADGSFYRVRTILGKTYELITGWFDESEHDAMQAMLIHNEVVTEISEGLKIVTLPEDSEYLTEWIENYEFIQASVRIEIGARASSNLAE